MRYRFQYVGADLRLTSPKPDTSRHCKTTDIGLVYHAICLFAPLAFAGYSLAPSHGGMAQAE